MLAAQIAALVLSVTGAPGTSGTRDTILLDFRADWCGPCRAMEPVVGQLAAAGYPVRMVNIDQDKGLAAQYHVHSIPCFVLLVDGREVDRAVGETDPGRLQAMFTRAGFDPRAVAASAAKGGTFAAGGGSDAAAFPVVVSNTTPFAAAQPAPSAAPPSAIPPIAEAAEAPPAAGTGLSDAKLLAACVRLKISDPTGNSYGSGTIIDVRNGEALILTCAHVFRESDGKGEILVDVFGPGERRQAKGRLVGCDLERDVGLVSIAATGPLTAIPVAPPGYTPKAGDRVVSIGCSHGADPTVQTSHVDSLDRFKGPPRNLQVAGQPVQGRSGGGLVSADGLVIGVCNAADPEDNEGMYAALASIHKELDRAGLAFVYKTPAAPASIVAAASPSDSPSMPARMPDVSLAADNSPAVSPAGSPTVSPAAESHSASAQLTPDEAAALAELRRKANGAEVICIVRPLADPKAHSEIIVLDKASSAFLEQLAAERRTQETRQLTSLAVPNK